MSNLAICIPASGFAVHDIPKGTCQFKLEVPTEKPEVILQIVHIHNGNCLLGGSVAGKLRVWDTDTGAVRQTLRYEGTHHPCLKS